jgi:uncharacterized membrane protein
MRRVAPAFVLFFLSPLVAEFLLGDFTLAAIGYLVLLAPMYGGGALLVRELTRRAGRGWPTIVLLALAYGVLEEGIATQSLFNPDYAGHHLLRSGFVPALGIAIPWTLYVLGLHTVWSISAPIALTEEWTGHRRTVPWLRGFGLTVSAVLFALAFAATTVFSWTDGHFMASWPQLVTVVVVAAVLIVTAFTLPRRAAAPAAAVPSAAVASGAASSGAVRPGRAPAAWVVLLVTLVAGALVMIGIRLPAVPGVIAMVVAYGGVTAAIVIWSGRAGWDAQHRFAAAAGAVLTYAWHSFLLEPLGGDGPVITPVSKVVFGVAAVALLAAEANRLRRRPHPAAVRPPEPARMPAR